MIDIIVILITFEFVSNYHNIINNINNIIIS